MRWIALFLSAALLSAQTAPKAATPAAAPKAGAAAAAPKPVATSKQLMEIMLIPASEALFDVGSKEPKTDADWAAVKKQAIILAEGGQLLLVPGRAKPGVWNNTARQLMVAGAASVKAADEKNVDKIIEIGDQILMACEGCHKQYLPKK